MIKEINKLIQQVTEEQAEMYRKYKLIRKYKRLDGLRSFLEEVKKKDCS